MTLVFSGQSLQYALSLPKKSNFQSISWSNRTLVSKLGNVNQIPLKVESWWTLGNQIKFVMRTLKLPSKKIRATHHVGILGTEPCSPETTKTAEGTNEGHQIKFPR